MQEKQKQGKSFFERVYEVLEQVPFGSVTTYGQIAALMGEPNGARAVGYAMHSCPAGLPWHRVLNKAGEIKFGGQRELLEREGITFLPGGHVNMKKHIWL